MLSLSPLSLWIELIIDQGQGVPQVNLGKDGILHTLVHLGSNKINPGLDCVESKLYRRIDTTLRKASMEAYDG